MSAHAPFPIRTRRRDIWTAAALALALFMAVLGARALWLHGFTTGAVTAECLDLFELYGPDAAGAAVCVTAHERYENDTIAWAMRQEAELELRRDAANRE